MTVSEAITSVRVMLGQNVPTKRVGRKFEDMPSNDVVTEEKITLSEDELVDGTIVYTEGDLVTGAVLYVKTPEGEQDVLAPIGKHQTKSGILVTVGEGGIVEAVEEVVAPAVEGAPVAEAMEDEKLLPVEEKMNAEELLKAIAELIKGYQEEVVSVQEELSQLKERFNAVADLPAAKSVKKSFMEDASAARHVAEARFDRLSALRRATIK
jgi:DNA topoisomerase IA